MKTIKVLTKDYQERFNIWINQAVKGGGKKRGRKKAPITETPNYLVEVIVPIITELAMRMPDHLIEIPDPETYGIGEGDMYPINIGKRNIGGLTYLNYGESQIHFIAVYSRKISKDRLPVNSILQLEHIVRNHLAVLNGRAPIEDTSNTDIVDSWGPNPSENDAKEGASYPFREAM